MKAVIMQPTYLPWMGYFDLMDQSDVFVLLDSVQFSKQSWHQRNKIKSNSGELLLTIPIVREFPSLIKDVKINNSHQWRGKHLKSIEQNYGKAEYFNRYIGFLREIYSREHFRLSDFTIPIILWIKDVLGVKCEIVRSSEIGAGGSKVDLIVDICRRLGADGYISPLGSKEYIDENNVFKKEKIKLAYHNYIHPEYRQLWGDFIPYLSVIDLIFNEGGNSLEIIRSGRRQPKEH